MITMMSQSAQKTESVHQPAPGKPYNEPTINVNGQNLKRIHLPGKHSLQSSAH